MFLSRHSFVFTLVFFLLARCATSPGAPEQSVPDFEFTTTVDGDGNTLAVSTEGRTVIIDVHSQSGIGRASLERNSDEIPEKIVLRLHLAGLEEFRLAYNNTILVASVSTSGSREIFQSALTPGEGEHNLTQDSPLWMDIRVVPVQAATSSGSPASYYFEITLPEDVLRSGQRFSIEWVDFYR